MPKKLSSIFRLIFMASTLNLSAQTFSLDGDWQFAVDTSGSLKVGALQEKAEWRMAKVPLSWQAQFADLRDYQGVAWYRKAFVLPKLKPSEFGNWGLPKLPENLPWWFERDFLGRQVTLPKGVHQRFKDFHYDQTFGTFNQLAEESQRAQFMALKYEIEQIRLAPEVQGYVITEFTDINWECNGLLDMWRNLKIYADDLANIQQQDVIIARPEKYNYWNGETASINLWLSHFSEVEIKEATLRWTVSSGAKGEITIPAKNLGKFAETLPATGFAVKNLSEKIAPLVTNVLDGEILQRLASGETAICLIDTTTKLPTAFPCSLTSREAEWYDGNWASNLNWLRHDRPPFRDISFGEIFGESGMCATAELETLRRRANDHSFLRNNLYD